MYTIQHPQATLLGLLNTLYEKAPPACVQTIPHHLSGAKRRQSIGQAPIIRVISLSSPETATCAHNVFKALQKAPSGLPRKGFGRLIRGCLTALVKASRETPEEEGKSTVKNTYSLFLMILGLRVDVPQFYGLLSQWSEDKTELSFIQAISDTGTTSSFAKKTFHAFFHIARGLKCGEKISAKHCIIHTHPYLVDNIKIQIPCCKVFRSSSFAKIHHYLLDKEKSELLAGKMPQLYAIEIVEKKRYDPNAQKNQGIRKPFTSVQAVKILHSLIDTKSYSSDSFFGKFQHVELSESNKTPNAFLSIFGFSPPKLKTKTHDEEHKGNHGKGCSATLSTPFHSRNTTPPTLSQAFQTLCENVPYLVFELKPTEKSGSSSPLEDRLIHIFPVDSPKYSMVASRLYSTLEKAHVEIDSQKAGLFLSAASRLSVKTKKLQGDRTEYDLPPVHYSSMITAGPVTGPPEFYSLVIQRTPEEDSVIMSVAQASQINPTPQERSFQIFQHFLIMIRQLKINGKISAEYCSIKTHPSISDCIRNDADRFEIVDRQTPSNVQAIYDKLRKKDSQHRYYIIEQYIGKRRKKHKKPPISNIYIKIDSSGKRGLDEENPFAHQVAPEPPDCKNKTPSQNNPKEEKANQPLFRALIGCDPRQKQEKLPASEKEELLPLSALSLHATDIQEKSKKTRILQCNGLTITASTIATKEAEEAISTLLAAYKKEGEKPDVFSFANEIYRAGFAKLCEKNADSEYPLVFLMEGTATNADEQRRNVTIHPKSYAVVEFGENFLNVYTHFPAKRDQTEEAAVLQQFLNICDYLISPSVGKPLYIRLLAHEDSLKNFLKDKLHCGKIVFIDMNPLDRCGLLLSNQSTYEYVCEKHPVIEATTSIVKKLKRPPNQQFFQNFRYIHNNRATRLREELAEEKQPSFGVMHLPDEDAKISDQKEHRRYQGTS